MVKRISLRVIFKSTPSLEAGFRHKKKNVKYFPEKQVIDKLNGVVIVFNITSIPEFVDLFQQIFFKFDRNFFVHTENSNFDA